MRKVDVSKRAGDFLKTRQKKQAKQIAQKILALGQNPMPNDCVKLTGSNFYRVDSGEFRIIYEFTDLVVRVILVGKRHE